METRNELLFQGEQAALDNFLSRLCADRGDWRQDLTPVAISALIKRRVPDKRFEYRPSGGGPHAKVIVSPSRVGEWAVTAVYPIDGPHAKFYAPADANAMLQKFADHAAPHARAARVNIVGPRPPQTDLADYTSPAAFARAATFLARATPPALTADDRERWRGFAIQAYRDGLAPPADVVERWLREKGWDSDAGRLTDDYAAVLAILGEYEEAARP